MADVRVDGRARAASDSLSEVEVSEHVGERGAVDVLVFLPRVGRCAASRAIPSLLSQVEARGLAECLVALGYGPKGKG
jgi:hypothetical protein